VLLEEPLVQDRMEMTLFSQPLHPPGAAEVELTAAPELQAAAGAAVLLPGWVGLAHPIKGLQAQMEMEPQEAAVVLRKPQHSQLVL
jgi:hypothetical protein